MEQASRRDVPSKTMNPGEQIASYIEHTLLKPDATAADIERLCAEARRHRFLGVCVNGSWVRHARLCLKGDNIKVVSVAGFPLGAASTATKRFETKAAIADGADEIDVVLNVGRLVQGDDGYVRQELHQVVQAAGGRPVKVILETCCWIKSKDPRLQAGRRKRRAFRQNFHRLQLERRHNFGCRLDAENRRSEFGVKAAGGIRDASTAFAMIGAGASRIGTSAVSPLSEAC